jgi:histidinol phosphatase-like PHP family hydrolase
MILAAIKKGLTKLCVTDHYSTFKPGLTPSELESYFNTLKEYQTNYSSKIGILVGIEVDVYSHDSFSDLSSLNWDLILFEYVFSVPDWEKKFKKMIKFKKNFPDYNIGLAHTRFSRVSESKFDNILNVIQEHEIIIELNTNYQNYNDRWFAYLDEDFWYSVGSDAHNLVQIGKIDTALEFLKSRYIPYNRITQI